MGGTTERRMTMKEIKVNLFKEDLRFTFPTEEEREEFGKILKDKSLSAEARLLGVVQEKRFYKMHLYVVNCTEIGAAFKFLQKLGYETTE